MIANVLLLEKNTLFVFAAYRISMKLPHGTGTLVLSYKFLTITLLRGPTAVILNMKPIYLY
jgi:hypothetical protein